MRTPALFASLALSGVGFTLAVGVEAQTVDRSRPPQLAPPPELRLPPIVQRTLPNGLRLLIVEHHELPLATFNLVIGSGASQDPAARSGTADFTAAMLREGAGSRTNLDIADQMAFLGVSLATNAGWDASTVFLHTPTAQLDSALALFADVALRPTFPTEDMERMRGRRLTSILQRRDQPPVIADLAYASLVFGNEHPYGRPMGGTEASTREVQRGELESYYRTHFRPNNATLIVVGDVTPDDIEARIARLFGSWERAEVPSVTLTEPRGAERTTIYLIDKPGATQSSFRLGHLGVPRSTSDYFSLVVLNTVLGGSFTARLMQNLRENHGYTYSAYSGFAFRRFAGPFVSQAEVVAAKSDSALIEFMKELRGIREPVPDDELLKAKRYLQLRFPGGFETTTGIANQLVPLVVYNLPLDYYEGYVRQIEAVTQADLQRVAARYINPDRMTIVVVGDRKQIEPPLRALGIAELVVRDVTGQPQP
jgi:predicted Zn-dependent peptidase